MGTRLKPVAELNAVRPAAAVLRDDAFAVLLRGEQKRPDGRGDRRRNFRNTIFADYSGTAGHVRHQADRGCTAFNRQRGFFRTTNTTDFYSRRTSALHLSVVVSFAVGYPDILHLGGVLEEPSTFAL